MVNIRPSTTINGKNSNIPNTKNIEIINEFLEYMKEVIIIQNIINITI
jgi:hypothetical protein